MIVLTETDLTVLKIIEKYKVINYKLLELITNEQQSNICRRMQKLEKNKYVLKHIYINNERLFTITRKTANLLDKPKSKSINFNPFNVVITYHELKVLETALYFSDKYNENILDMLVHRDLVKKFNKVGIVDLVVNIENMKIAIEVERTSKGVKRTREKIINELDKKYDKIIFLINKKHYNVVNMLIGIADIYNLLILNYDDYDVIYEGRSLF